MQPRLAIARSALREYAGFDLGWLRQPAGAALLGASAMLRMGGKRERSAALLMQTHHAAFSPGIDRRVVERIARDTALERKGQSTGLWDTYRSTISEAVRNFRQAKRTPASLVGSRILVVKAARPRERGIILVDYTYVFPLLAGLFDLRALAEKYYIVLEPSWSDSCIPEILLFTQYDFPVFVQSIEPRDRMLFDTLGSNCRVVPTAPNWWVDYRLMSSSPDTPKDIDVIMVAAWTAFKRHWRFFKVLADLKRRGHRLKVALVGYAAELTQADIEAQADLYGVRDQLEFFERVKAPEVAKLLGRSKVHVLWSRREGANRAIVEAMLAGVPVIVREGLTYGLKYPYINSATGAFATEANLGDAILDIIKNHARYSPREWVLANMTCQRAAAIVDERVKEYALQAGETWTEGMVARTSALDSQRYWNPDDRARFEADYRYVESTIVKPSGA